MFKTLTALAVTAYAAVAIEDVVDEASSTLDDAQCNSIVAGGMYYDISALNNDVDPYSKSVTGASPAETLEFNYCETLDNDSYGWIVQTDTIVATQGAFRASMDNMRDADEEIIGLEMT